MLLLVAELDCRALARPWNDAAITVLDPFGCVQGYWLWYNLQFYSRVQRYNSNLDGLLDKEINANAGDYLQVVAATKLQM